MNMDEFVAAMAIASAALDNLVVAQKRALLAEVDVKRSMLAYEAASAAMQAIRENS